MHQQEMEHLNSAIIRLRNEIESLKVAVTESNQTRAETYNHEILEQKLISLERQVDDQKETSYDGTLIWKITGFKQKQGRLTNRRREKLSRPFLSPVADAQAERQLSVYSPPFYSSSTGYKMCCRLYPCGDGNARNTHMSLFFVLMRGDYDDLLTFPFNFKVTFILYDQTGQGRHIVDSFRPDVKSNSFQKPQSSMNIASGIPKFFPLAMLQQDDSAYIRNDTIYIKTIVDFDGLPKAVLPYVISLNPGLPDSLRKKLIQQEIEKQTTTT